MRRNNWVFHLMSLMLHGIILLGVSTIPKGESLHLTDAGKGICYVHLVEAAPSQKKQTKSTHTKNKALYKHQTTSRVTQRTKPKNNRTIEKKQKQPAKLLSKGKSLPKKDKKSPTDSTLTTPKTVGKKKVATTNKRPNRNTKHSGTYQSTLVLKKESAISSNASSHQTHTGSLGEAIGKGGLVVLPSVTRRIKPSYPPIAKRMGYQGRVIVRLLVSAEGRVKRVKVIRSSGYGILDRAAVQALQKWRFSPALRNGIAVSWWVEVPVVFNLEQGS